MHIEHPCAKAGAVNIKKTVMRRVLFIKFYRLVQSMKCSKANIHNHNSPIECQYQALASVAMRRDSKGLDSKAAKLAQNRAVSPPTRWTACAPVRMKKKELLGLEEMKSPCTFKLVHAKY